MNTLAEKIEASKKCCRKIKDFVAEKREEFNEKFFQSDWEVFVVKRDTATGEYVGRFAACAVCSV